MNPAYNCALILMAAFLIDFFIGDPVYSLHPVRITGSVIYRFDHFLRQNRFATITGGIILLCLSTGLIGTGFMLLRFGLSYVHPSLTIIFDIFMLYSCIGSKDMIVHAQSVTHYLKAEELDNARHALQKIVGRNTRILDNHAVARAAAETVAEGFVDGVLSPIFWYAAGCTAGYLLNNADPSFFGIGGALIFRIVNTLDSMVGYNNEIYVKFGKAAARFDDILNWIPARLSIPVLFISAILCRLDASAGLKTACKDRRKHASPNSGHPESFIAGALHLRLGGPVTYPHGTLDKPWMGDGTPLVSAGHIRACCRLFTCGGWTTTFILSAIIVVLYRILNL